MPIDVRRYVPIVHQDPYAVDPAVVCSIYDTVTQFVDIKIQILQCNTRCKVVKEIFGRLIGRKSGPLILQDPVKETLVVTLCCHRRSLVHTGLAEISQPR